MKIPESLRVNGIEYGIAKIPNLNDGTKVLFGRVLYNDTTIALNEDVNPQMQGVTLWHELVHEMVFRSTIDIPDDLEEKICDIVGYGVYQILQDNARKLFDIVESKDGKAD